MPWITKPGERYWYIDSSSGGQMDSPKSIKIKSWKIPLDCRSGARWSLNRFKTKKEAQAARLRLIKALKA